MYLLLIFIFLAFVDSGFCYPNYVHFLLNFTKFNTREIRFYCDSIPKQSLAF
jgi:hypothetical protein